MTILNYALAGGNKTLLQVQAEGREVMFQAWYKDVVAADVSIEVWISTDAAGPYAKVDAATKAIMPAAGTAVINLSGVSYAFIQFRLVASGGTAGTLERVDAVGCRISKNING